MRNIYKVLSEKYLLVNEQEEKTGDVTPDGESTLTIDDSGNKFWLNKLYLYHRLDGPAFVHDDGSKEWYINGKHHRLDGPAVIYTYGRKEWYVNGKRHRLDGPAIDDPNIVYRQYWIDGVQYSYNDWRKEAPFRKNLDAIHKKGSEDSGLNLGALNEQEEKTGDVTPDGESTLKIDRVGNKFWYNKQGQFHRRNGPAVKETDGSKEWWVNGNLHRLDGPAIERPNGYKRWFIDGKLYSYEDWKKEVEHRKNLADIHKKGSEDSGLNIGALNEQEEKEGDVTPDGESTLEIDKDGATLAPGAKVWRNKQGQLHRRNGPAVNWFDRSIHWFVNGKRHRLDGPAIEYEDGFKQWHIDGKAYSYEDWKKEVEHLKKLDTIYGKGKEVDLNLKGL